MQEKHEIREVGSPDIFYQVSKLQNYVQYGTVLFFPKGSYVALLGEEINKLFYVLSGKLQLNCLLTDGKERMVFLGGKHSVFNHLYPSSHESFFKGCLLALEDSKVCCFSEKQIEYISHMDVDLILDLLKNSNAGASFFMKQAVEKDHLSSAIRVVRLLHELCISSGISLENHIEVNVTLPLKKVSEITGVHYVTVSRVFTSLKRQNILVKEKNKLVVYHLEKLKELTQQKYLKNTY